MNIKLLETLEQLLKEQPNLEMEITLDDNNTFTTSKFMIEQIDDLIAIGLETSSSPAEYAFFSLERIHHIVLKSRNKKKISFRLEDLPSLNKPQEPQKQISERIK